MREVFPWLIWRSIRRRKRFTTIELARDAVCEESTARKYLNRLIEKGVVSPAEQQRGRYTVYVLNDRYAHFLRMPIDFPESDRDRMWRAIRVLRVFTSPDLQTCAGLSRDTVDKFIYRLRRARLVDIVQQRVNGEKNSHQRYALRRDLGLYCPVFLRDGRVFDPNSGDFLEV